MSLDGLGQYSLHLLQTAPINNQKLNFSLQMAVKIRKSLNLEN